MDDEFEDIEVNLPAKIKAAFELPRGSLDYRCFYGGRGGGKSFSVALMVLIWGVESHINVWCVRKYFSSIKNSFFAELTNAIKENKWLDEYYVYGKNFIEGRNGTNFIFGGVELNKSSAKSTAQIDVLVMEEAEDISMDSFDVIFPTIRKEGAEIIVIWNPKDENSAVDKLFIKNKPDNSVIVQIGYQDNPWFSKRLDNTRKLQKQTLPDDYYRWIWDGEYLKNNIAAVFNGRWEILDFEAKDDWDGAYYGLDFGDKHPTAAVRCWLHADAVWIDYEGGGSGIELSEMPAKLSAQVPGILTNTVRADAAWAQSIRYLQAHGMDNITPAKKGAGSVDNGVKFLKSKRRIYIHSRCLNVIDNFRKYSYIQTAGGDITDRLEKVNDDWIDALRYALESMINGADTSHFWN